MILKYLSHIMTRIYYLPYSLNQIKGTNLPISIEKTWIIMVQSHYCDIILFIFQSKNDLFRKIQFRI